MDKKSILIGALGASLLFVTIGAGTQQEEATNTTVPESHVWEFHLEVAAGNGTEGFAFAINKKTGEVRKYNTYHSKPSSAEFADYCVTKPVEPEEKD